MNICSISKNSVIYIGPSDLVPQNNSVACYANFHRIIARKKQACILFVFRKGILKELGVYFFLFSSTESSNDSKSPQWRKPGAEFWGTEKIFVDQDDFFLKKCPF